ncbi:FtsX-like permease family protein [Campylobacter sp. VBCF_07 NA4]|uniref:ABC transporter permease n=1 Tax=Campylobacter sp. VBCF_07 NA4 TaxID=2983835 RepID=UPI0022E9B956|nr:FtsX-like permease family protein [Campylobacter sp. VBCF_07 NA4]MDA3055208.1 FtsX-like permease family protein [Campylobacter sp. VBCF_07 NA4]
MVENNKFYRTIVLKSIFANSLRSFVIFIAIALGSAVCAAFVNIWADIDKKVAGELNSYGANLIISPNSSQNFIISEDELRAKFEKIPNLKAHNSYLFKSANLGVNSAVVMGVEFSNLAKTMPFLQLKEGELIRVDFDDKNALIGEDLAKILGVKLGDEIGISPHNASANFTHKVRIKGIVFDGGKEDSLLLISLNLAQNIFGAKGEINYAEAIVDSDFKGLSKISQNLSDEKMSFNVVGKVSKTQGIILDKIKLLMLLSGFTILAITSICINTSLSQVLLSRIKEFALLRAIGANRANIFHIILGEILLLCVSGAVFGAIIGYFLAIILGQILFSSGVDFRFIGLVMAVILSLIFALSASYYPIKRALNPNLANLLKE